MSPINSTTPRDSHIHEFYRRYVFEADGVEPSEAWNLALTVNRWWMDQITRIFYVLTSYQTNQNTALSCRMSTRAMALALGLYDAAGAESSGDLARRLRMKKATVNKCLNLFIREKLHLPDLPGQRKPAARARMAASRRAQLRPHKSHPSHNSHPVLSNAKAQRTQRRKEPFFNHGLSAIATGGGGMNTDEHG